MSQQIGYAPPPYPPPSSPLVNAASATGHPPGLLPSPRPLPYGLDLRQLARNGWAALDLDLNPADPLAATFADLFQASSQFLSLPEEHKQRFRVDPRASHQVSEEGYSRVEGEKCMITIRKARTCPAKFGLRDRAEVAWRASAAVMRDVLAAIEHSLGMNEGVLVRTVEAQLEMPDEGSKNVATLIRMFQYDRPSSASASTPIPTTTPHPRPDASPMPDVPPGCPPPLGLLPRTGAPPRTVAEPHKDLGVLTIVVGHSPGLECWDSGKEAWVSCETRTGMNATLLVGQTLTIFTNGRYQAGRHRVCVHPSSSPAGSDTESSSAFPASTNTATPAATLAADDEERDRQALSIPPSSVLSPSKAIASSSTLSNPAHRYSLVHALRGHHPVIVSHTEFETPLTGPYHPGYHFRASVLEIFQAISASSFNVNISVKQRRKQEEELAKRTAGGRSHLGQGSGTAQQGDKVQDGGTRDLELMEKRSESGGATHVTAKGSPRSKLITSFRRALRLAPDN